MNLTNSIDINADLGEFKNEIEFLHTMLTATQEKRVPSPGKNDMIYFDGVILAHCNEAEWNRFRSAHTNEAILDRVVKINVPYVLELDEEVKIYEKILGKSGRSFGLAVRRRFFRRLSRRPRQCPQHSAVRVVRDIDVRFVRGFR